MPFKDPQKQKEYLREYYEKNKDSLIELAKENPNRKKNNMQNFLGKLDSMERNSDPGKTTLI